MPQNIYDDSAFFEGYSQFQRSRQGLAGAPEWPALAAMLPDLTGARVLDLGCGFGAFDRWAVEQGAQHVVAVDLSAKMLARARALTETERVHYVRADITTIDAIGGEFDLVYSALALHYIEDFAALCGQLRARLVRGGRLVASVEHPVYTAPSRPGWQDTEDGRVVWPLDSYLEPGKRLTDWITEGVVKYHRTLQGYLDPLLDHGFRLHRLVEWAPDAVALRAHPEWARELHRPMFLLFSADAA